MQVARDMLGGEPDEALRRVLGRVGGQPLLLTELLRGLRAENLVTVDGSMARLAVGAQLPRRLVDSVSRPVGAADRARPGRRGDGVGARAQLFPG